MEPNKSMAGTPREALNIGGGLVRRSFWYFAPPALAYCAVGLLGAGVYALFNARGLLAAAVVVGAASSCLQGMLGLGLLRGCWDAMRGGSVSTDHLLWAFGKRSRWSVPVLWVLVSLPTMLPHRIPGAGRWSAWHLLAGLAYGLAAVLVHYALAATAREDCGIGEALRAALGTFMPGRRRWLLVPFLIGLATIGALMVVALAMAGAAIALAALRVHVSTLEIGVLLLLLGLPMLSAWVVASMLLAGGSMLAAVGGLRRDGAEAAPTLPA